MWDVNHYTIDLSDPAELENADTLEAIYQRACRADLSQPGFCLILFPGSTLSEELRHWMVLLKRKLSIVHRNRHGSSLCYRSMGRFNQQLSTRFHLDGAPEESLLMLGYEPTVVASRIYLADYTRAAYERGISPRTFLEHFNPMFNTGEDALEPYTTELAANLLKRPYILLINNSSADPADEAGGLLGVLHKAIIEDPLPDQDRVVNSTMIETCCPDCADAVPPEDQGAFVSTMPVRGSVL